MAIRVNWKGYLKLSLVSCAVAMVPATSTSERTRFHTINKTTGNRLRQRMVDEETGDEVPREERVKGYEVSKNEFVTVTSEELEGVALESTHTIDIERFVPRDEIDKRYLDQPYYLFPNDKVSGEAFAVIRDAMTNGERVALARVVMYSRERIVMIEALETGMLATTLRYAYEVRDSAPYFEDIETKTTSKDMIDLATHIIEQKSGHFEPKDFEDRYENAVIDLLKSKQAGEPIRHAPAPRKDNVVNLMDALRKSVTGASSGNDNQPAKASRASPKRAAAKKTAARSARPVDLSGRAIG